MLGRLEMNNSNNIAKKLLLEKELSIDDIQGDFMLSGVEFGLLPGGEEKYDDCNTITIILDDIPLTFVEDPDDGYRSTLDRVFVGGDVRNKFQPIAIHIEYSENSQDHSECQLLYGYDIKSNKECLIIGTDNTDDYYPLYVAEWKPENLYVNHISS